MAVCWTHLPRPIIVITLLLCFINIQGYPQRMRRIIKTTMRNLFWVLLLCQRWIQGGLSKIYILQAPHGKKKCLSPPPLPSPLPENLSSSHLNQSSWGFNPCKSVGPELDVCILHPGQRNRWVCEINNAFYSISQ